MTDNNQRVNEQAERELLMRFVAIITGATSLGENRVYDLAEALISVAHAAIEQAAPEAPAAASVKTWQERLQEAHPHSDPEYWQCRLRLKYAEIEIADLRAALVLAQQSTKEKPHD